MVAAVAHEGKRATAGAMDKLALKNQLTGLRAAYEQEKNPHRREAIKQKGLKIRELLGLSDDPEIERRQLRALEIAEEVAR